MNKNITRNIALLTLHSKSNEKREICIDTYIGEMDILNIYRDFNKEIYYF